MLEAAADLFMDRGYAGTTLPAVAARADVSLATVKLVAATKANLLLEVANAGARGDTKPAPMSERAFWAEMLAAPTAADVLRRFAAISAGAHQRQARLFVVISQAAPADPELAEAVQRGADSRRADCAVVVDELIARHALRPDLNRKTAIEIVWALNSPQVFRLFAEQAWSREQWERWLFETLRTQLVTHNDTDASA